MSDVQLAKQLKLREIKSPISEEELSAEGLMDYVERLIARGE
jgi:hypothetical protein